MVKKTLLPSRYMLQKAWKLGQKMAMTERRVKPVLFDAHEYPSHGLFVQVHRHRMEQLSAFRPWDEKLQFLIEREGYSRDIALDDPRVWDAFFNQIAVPIRNSFWYGWEQVYRLEELYHKQVELANGKKAKQEVVHVYAPPVAQRLAVNTLPDESETGIWDKVAAKLFDDMQGDNNEALWELPEAHAVLPMTPPKQA